uniref:Uncharacterized protein n=1 Tax=Anguilla anguilla TaxID=7936 RepID=A0A0E9XYT0_ANGAN
MLSSTFPFSSSVEGPSWDCSSVRLDSTVRNSFQIMLPNVFLRASVSRDSV